MRALNLKNFTSLPSLDFILGTGRFLGPQRVEVAQNDGVVRQLNSNRIFIDTGTRPAIPDPTCWLPWGVLPLSRIWTYPLRE
jgi:pyruvate/2-oxoglutarate dehydrogenase complex dihydrolipoamide dehydrogenase (E3) component